MNSRANIRAMDRAVSRVPLEYWLGLAAALLTAMLLKYGWSPFDDGVYVWSAQRLLDGAVLHGNLQGNHPGYSMYADAMLFHLFGSDFSVLRYPLPLIAGVLTAIIAWLLRPLGRAMQFLAAFAAASLGVVQFITPSSGWYAVGASAIALALFVKAMANPAQVSVKLLLLTGVLIGICAGFRQLNGAMLGCGLVILHAWLASPVADGPIPARGWQAISLLSILAAACLLALPFLAAPSLLAGVYSFPACWCAGRALANWKGNPRTRDPRWLLPVLAGCALGFLPAVAVPLAQGTLSGFIADTVTDAAAFGGYSALRDVNFDLSFIDAMELFAQDSAFAYAGGAYLVIVGLTPLVFSLQLCVSRNALSDRTATVVMFAAISLPISITFQGLIYASYWLPAVMAAILAMTAQNLGGSRKAAAIFVLLPSVFALIFLSGRVPGSRTFEVLSEPWHRLVACTLPHCDLRVDPYLLDGLEKDYHDIQAHVPADRPLLLLPNGASLYGSLPHPSPWSTSFVIKGLFADKQVARLKQEFLARPDAILAVNRQYLSSTKQIAEIHPFMKSLCLARQSLRHLFFTACPTSSPRPEHRPGAPDHWLSAAGT